MEIEMRGINKSFGNNAVLNNAGFVLSTGEIHALMGENGAGKSTLMKILTGVYTKDVGQVIVDGQEVCYKNAREAEKAGIVFIHQELNVLFDLTVEENMFLGKEIKKKCGVCDKKAMRREVEKILKRLGVEIDPGQRMEELSVGQQQMVEIAKALMVNAKVIIMDEPTVAVDPQSRNKILEGIQTLNHQGSTIIYTSHYMEEVEQICTRIAIMDHGHVIASGTKEELKKMIKTGETITIEAIPLTSENLADIRALPHVFDLHYEEQILTVRCTGARHNLIRLLNYLQSQDISFGQVSSELPTLNDVFLEITGKQLRD